MLQLKKMFFVWCVWKICMQQHLCLACVWGLCDWAWCFCLNVTEWWACTCVCTNVILLYPDKLLLTRSRWWWMSCVSARFWGPSARWPPGGWTPPDPLPVPAWSHPKPAAWPAPTRARDAAAPCIRCVLCHHNHIRSQNTCYTTVLLLSFNLSSLHCVLMLQVLRTLENCLGVCLRLCLQRTSYRLCTLSLQSCRDWPWSSSGFTATTTCTEALCLDRRTTTGQWITVSIYWLKHIDWKPTLIDLDIVCKAHVWLVLFVFSSLQPVKEGER